MHPIQIVIENSDQGAKIQTFERVQTTRILLNIFTGVDSQKSIFHWGAAHQTEKQILIGRLGCQIVSYYGPILQKSAGLNVGKRTEKPRILKLHQGGITAGAGI